MPKPKPKPLSPEMYLQQITDITIYLETMTQHSSNSDSVIVVIPTSLLHKNKVEVSLKSSESQNLAEKLWSIISKMIPLFSLLKFLQPENILKSLKGMFSNWLN